MAEPLFSPSWYRVARLRPRLRGHVHVHRHEYRGEIWYVLQDHSKGRYYRFSPVAYQLIGQMDGARSVQALWERANERFGDEGPSQQEVIRLLSQLHAADVLQSDVPPDTAELLERSRKIETAKRRMNFRSPMALRFPLLDPDRFLSRTAFLVRPLFSVWGAALWLATVAAAVVLGVSHWPELTENLVDRVLSAQNLLLIWLVYPLIKALHELGHGYAVKVWGGEVHEMGIMLLVLMPVPYVDASAASEFRARHRRVLVGAAGIIVELFLASLAMFLWVLLEPGLARSVAYNVILIGSISTLLFNGNPLLRFDGYYILADLLEIPNLGQRGLQYLGYLVKRHVFRIKDATPPYVGPGERAWFVLYSVSAFVYRMFIYVGIILFVAGKFFVIGVLLAIWAGSSMVAVPVSKGLKFVMSSRELRERRPRAILFSGGAILAVLLLIFGLPVPHRTLAEGVVWVPEDAVVRAAASGFVVRVAAEPNSHVEAGQLLFECEDPLLRAQAVALRARLRELESRYDQARATDRSEARIVAEERDSVAEELRRADERLSDLAIRSPATGRFVLPKPADLPGRHLKQGELLAWVLDVERPTVRVVVPQSGVDLVRRSTRGVEVRLAERLERVLPAAIRREVPEAAERLPSTTLGSAGGGEIAIDPYDEGRTRTFEKLFQFDLEVTQPLDRVFIGGRAHVRFDHGLEPLGLRWYRDVRRLLLRRFNV